MANVELVNICRFCLSHDHNQLRCISKAINSTLTVEDLEIFTGIQIATDELGKYTVCRDCINSLMKAAEFRRTSLSNDLLFGQLCAELDGKRSQEESDEDDENLQFIKIDQIRVEFVYDTQESMKQDVVEDETIVDYFWEDESEDSVGQVNDATDNQFSNRPTPDDQVIESCDSLTQAKPISSSHNVEQLCSITLHRKNNLYACPHCPTKMNHLTNLGRHVRAVHLKTIMKTCELCKKGFTHNNSYVSHMRSHHDIGKTYECKECSRQFQHNSGFWAHMKRFHTNDSRFGCETCGKIFKTKIALKSHENVHTSNISFACSQCPKRFRSRSAKNIHQQTHSGILFECKICDKLYRYKNRLQSHVKKAHFSDDVS